MHEINNKQLYYDNVALLPNYSTLRSRKEADTSIVMGKFKFNLPVVPANMKCTIDEKLAFQLSEKGYFYIMHRFDIDVYNFVEQANQQNWKCISISVGVKDFDIQLVKRLTNYRVDFITVDIAHGHCLMMKEMIEVIKQYLPTTFIIAGNVCTPEGFNDLAQWGAHAVKVGVGPGAACTTKLKTGFTYPMFSCIRNIVDNMKTDALLIADGGINYNGDIAKAICAGADLIMCGKLFSECIDSPAPIKNGSKLYYGSASVFNKNHTNNIEGKQIEVVCNGLTYEEKLNEITQDLQSSISYAGGLLKHLQHTKYIVI